MSEYLRRKLISNLRQAKEGLSENFDHVRQDALNEGMKDMVSKIGDMDIKVESAHKKPEVTHTPRYEGKELAEVAIDVYRSNINPNKPTGKPQLTQNQPITPAYRANIRAIANSLAGMRNGGDAGKMGFEAGPNGGDAGKLSMEASENGGNKGVGGNYHAHTTTMTLEEYQEYINNMWGLNEKKMPPDDKVNKAPSPKQEKSNKMEDAVIDLEKDLKESGATDWVTIDKMMRAISNQYGYTPKELHKAFKSKHGMIPDDWISEQVEYGIAGWFPLTEAKLLHKHGMVYEVSLVWRGQNRRIKFFWPELGFPTREAMVEAADKFYPGSRLLAYYRSADDSNNNFMVLVPPMSEQFDYFHNTDWQSLTEEETQFVEFIEQEEGEVVSPIQFNEEGSYVTIQDYDSGELVNITFTEGSLRDWFGKSKSKDGKKGWVNVVTGDSCASDKPGEGIPKCVSSSKRASMSKDERKAVAAKKRREDPGQQSKSGASKPTYVKTDVKEEKDRKGKGSGTKDACYHKVKSRFSVWPSAYGSGALVKCRRAGAANWGNSSKKEEVEHVDEACWKGYTKKGMKTMFGKRYPNCVKKEETGDVTGHGSRLDTAYHYDMMDNDVSKDDIRNRKIKALKAKNRIKKEEYVSEDDMKGMSQKSGDKRSTESGAGMTSQGVAKYRRRNPGSKLKTAVTTPPSKLKPGSKAANRRKSFCARSRSWNGERGKAARRRWNC